MISTLVENRTPSDITSLKSQEKCLIQLGEQSLRERRIGKSLAADARQIFLPTTEKFLVGGLNDQDERSQYRKLENGHFAFLYNPDNKWTEEN